MGKRSRKKTEEVYDVEAIVSKRINGETTEYLVKWRNYSSDENTWEPIEHLNCKQMITEYEEKHSGEEVEHLDLIIEPGNGFQHEWQPIKVFGATKRHSDGRLMIMIKWKGNKSSFEFSEIANEKIPQLVIAYYEQRIRWKNGNKPLERAVLATNSFTDPTTQDMQHN